HAVQPGLDLQRLDRRKERVEGDLLIDDADRALGIAWLGVDVEPPDAGAPRGLVHQSRQDVDQRRVARAIGAEQAITLPTRDPRVDGVQRLFAALIDLAQALDLGRRIAHVRRSGTGGRAWQVKDAVD